MVYIGSYTSGEGGADGIGLASVDPSGVLESARTVAEVADPSFLALSEDGRFLYAVHELDDGQVGAYAVSADGTLRALGQRPTHGAHPCHLAIDPSGRYLLSANYGSGSVAVHPIGPDGSLGDATDVVQHSGSGPRPDRQEGPHAHAVGFHGDHVFAVDLGTDSVYASRLLPDAGRLDPVSQLTLTPGAGPRHLTFHPAGHTAYVINELDSTLSICSWDPAADALTAVDSISIRPPDASGENYPAEILISPDGRFLYCSNRGDDTIAVLSTDTAGRQLTLTQSIPTAGTWPRHLAFAGPTLYAANERSNSITSFTTNPESGTLTPTPHTLSWPKPVCLLPTGQGAQR